MTKETKLPADKASDDREMALEEMDAVSGGTSYYGNTIAEMTTAASIAAADSELKKGAAQIKSAKTAPMPKAGSGKSKLTGL